MTDRGPAQPEAARYRDAAESALAQLDWCVRYFDRIRQPRIADVLASNIRQIRRALR